MRALLVHSQYRTTQPSGENASFDEEATLLEATGCDVCRLLVSSDEIATWPARRKALLPLTAVWSRSGTEMMRRAIEEFEPDVVHVHNTFPLLSPAVLRTSRAAGVPTVVTLRNFRAYCASGSLLRDGRECTDCMSRTPWPAVRHGCYRGSRLATLPVATMVAVHRLLDTWQAADRIVFPSQFARDAFATVGWPTEKLVVKPNVVRALSPVRDGAGEGFVIMSRLSSEKGLDVLLEAWQVAFPRGEERLTVIGSGDDEERIRRKAQGLAGIQFVGTLPRREAMGLVGRSRALLMPSVVGEFFGRTVVEAFSAGVPVIASNAGALPELVEHGRTGLLVAPGSVSELATALAALAGSPRLAVELGRQGYEVFCERFSPEQTTRALLTIYDDLVTGRAGSKGHETASTVKVGA